MAGDPVLARVELTFRTDEDPHALADRVREATSQIVGREALEEFRLRVLPLAQSRRGRRATDARAHGPPPLAGCDIRHGTFGRPGYLATCCFRSAEAASFGRGVVRRAAVAAAGAMVAMRAHVAQLEANRPDLGAPTTVVVAARDLARGLTLATASLEVVEMPSTFAPPGVVTSIEGHRAGARDRPGRGRGAHRDPPRRGGPGPIAALVPPGLRAFVLPTGPPAGTVRPGDAIDVLATYGANAGRPYTETVASALEVLRGRRRRSAGRDGVGGAPAGPPIVVLADPLTVERLARASSLALLSISIAGDGTPITDTFSEGGPSVAWFSRRTPPVRDAPPAPRCRYRATAAPRPTDGRVSRAGSTLAQAHVVVVVAAGCSWWPGFATTFT